MPSSIIRQSVFICLIAIILTLLSAFFHPSRPAWSEETLKEGEVRLRDVLTWDDVLWVDARTRYRGMSRNALDFALHLIAYNWKRSFSLQATET